ncbi:MAG TPA: general secretion pathway protein GspB [Ramlibacter sp.]|nr:general secretion pathway protein GspB [Ramlibacter sp.]
MSYILDALRKADADRERDPARGIHAQPLSQAAASGRQGRFLGWGAAGLLALSALGAGYAWLRAAEPTPVQDIPVDATPVAPVATAFDPPAPTVQAAPAPTMAGPPAAVPVATAVQPAPPPVTRAPPAVTAAPSVTVAAAPPAAKPVPPPRPAAVAQARPADPTATPEARPAAPAVDASRVYAVSELPPEVQRELPKLAISGSVHSDVAAQRMLIVGGQVIGEGAELAPGAVLEQIRPKAAVVRFRGYRYSVGF